MKRIALFLPFVLVLSACSVNSAAVAVASLGIAGAGLSAYCASTKCTAAVTAYGGTVIAEATRDVAVLEHGQTTVAQVSEISANISDLLIQGHLLQNAPPQVAAIISAANSVLPLVTALLSHPQPSTAAPLTARTVVTVTLPPLTAADKAKIAGMRAKVAALKK
jgi:hypothetical protein